MKERAKAPAIERLAPGQRRSRPGEIDELLLQTHESDAKARRAAVHALCPCSVQADHERVWDRLLEMVSDPDPRVRSDVLHTLCDGSPRGREADVVQALEHIGISPRDTPRPEGQA